MQSSSPTFSPPSTVTVSIFSCKGIKKKIIQSWPQTTVLNKAQSTRSSKESTKRSTKKHQLWNYQTWKFTVRINKFNMNFSKSASWWPNRLKALIHFWQVHNFCERLSCDWSFLSSIPHKVMQDSTAAIQSEDST